MQEKSVKNQTSETEKLYSKKLGGKRGSRFKSKFETAFVMSPVPVKPGILIPVRITPVICRFCTAIASLKKGIFAKTNTYQIMNNTKKVADFMATLEHPLKAEMAAVRAIIVNADPKMEEDVKWGGPSFFYKEDLATFNPRIKNYVALIFHKGDQLGIESDFLEEATKGKVYAKFYTMDQVTAQKELLEKMVHAWIALMDKQQQ